MFFRQFHRWTSIVFTATVIANFVAMSFGAPPAWITYSPLLPLTLLMLTGLYLFLRKPAVTHSRRAPTRDLDVPAGTSQSLTQ